jgi:hypothetical protein
MHRHVENGDEDSLFITHNYSNNYIFLYTAIYITPPITLIIIFYFIQDVDSLLTSYHNCALDQVQSGGEEPARRISGIQLSYDFNSVLKFLEELTADQENNRKSQIMLENLISDLRVIHKPNHPNNPTDPINLVIILKLLIVLRNLITPQCYYPTTPKLLIVLRNLIKPKCPKLRSVPPRPPSVVRWLCSRGI